MEAWVTLVGGGGGECSHHGIIPAPQRLIVRVLPSSYRCTWEIAIKHKSRIGVYNFSFLCVLYHFFI